MQTEATTIITLDIDQLDAHLKQAKQVFTDTQRRLTRAIPIGGTRALLVSLNRKATELQVASIIKDPIIGDRIMQYLEGAYRIIHAHAVRNNLDGAISHSISKASTLLHVRETRAAKRNATVTVADVAELQTSLEAPARAVVPAAAVPAHPSP